MSAQPYPFGPAEGLTPHPRYAELREPTRILAPYGGEAWLVTGYHDTRTVLADPRFSRAAAAGKDSPRARPPIDSPDQILSMDPPGHTRLRRLVAKAFTVRRVERLRPRMTEIVEDLVDRGVTDLVADLAWPLPTTVICELLGVPAADHTRFREWTEATLALRGLEEMAAARSTLNTYLAGLIAQRREEPADDLLSALVAARDEGDRLSEEELVRLGVTLLISGHETTANQIGNFLYLLLEDPRRWDALSDVPRAVEELLRFTPMAVVADFARIATTDVVLGGQTIKAGEAVLVQLHAANRDPDVFAAAADLDLDRADNPHVAFGHGTHHCLGAHLARVELQVVLSTLRRRMPSLRLADPSKVEWRANRLVRGPVALPVA